MKHLEEDMQTIRPTKKNKKIENIEPHSSKPPHTISSTRHPYSCGYRFKTMQETLSIFVNEFSVEVYTKIYICYATLHEMLCNLLYLM